MGALRGAGQGSGEAAGTFKGHSAPWRSLVTGKEEMSHPSSRDTTLSASRPITITAITTNALGEIPLKTTSRHMEQEVFIKGKLYLFNLIDDWQIPFNLNYLGILWIKNIFPQLLAGNTELNHLPQIGNKIKNVWLKQNTQNTHRLSPTLYLNCKFKFRDTIKIHIITS